MALGFMSSYRGFRYTGTAGVYRVTYPVKAVFGQREGGIAAMRQWIDGQAGAVGLAGFGVYRKGGRLWQAAQARAEAANQAMRDEEAARLVVLHGRAYAASWRGAGAEIIRAAEAQLYGADGPRVAKFLKWRGDTGVSLSVPPLGGAADCADLFAVHALLSAAVGEAEDRGRKGWHRYRNDFDEWAKNSGICTPDEW